jgi:phosphomannomutase
VAELDRAVFKSYDIRGTYPNQLDERFAYRLGRSLVAVLRATRVAVGHDARLSSPSLYAALAAGLRDAGALAEGMGLCATELVYYAMGMAARPDAKGPACLRGLDLGVMITASHNPPEYNGFKVVRAGGEPLSGAAGLEAVRAHMETLTADLPSAVSPPDKTIAVEEDYLDFALRLVGEPDVRGLRVAVDAGNGVAGLLWQGLSGRLGIEPVRLNFDPDGGFPAHHPDPSRRENLEQLIQAVHGGSLGLGFCYDGDADRVVVVLKDGHVVDGSEMIACIVERLLTSAPALAFGVGQTTSRKALDHFARRGAQPLMLPVGHAKIKRLMRASPRMAFAGEDAGHCYYRDFFCCDSSLITTLHLLHLTAGGALEDFVRSLPGPWLRPEHEPSFAFADQTQALETCRQVALIMLERHPEPTEITCERDGRIARQCDAEAAQDCDGVRVDYPAWWFCARPSGTEPIARLAVEARSKELLDKMTNMLSSLFTRLRSAWG